MLDEEIEEADFVVLQFRKIVGDLVGDEVAAPRFGGQRDGLLEPGHLG